MDEGTRKKKARKAVEDIVRFRYPSATDLQTIKAWATEIATEAYELGRASQKDRI